MGSSVTLGIVFAVLTAFASIVGFLYKHKGAVESPPVEWRRPVRTSLALFASKWYVLGIGPVIAGFVALLFGELTK